MQMKLLFVCSMNSARSILAEALANDRYGGKFLAQSAGVRPAGSLMPEAADCLRRHGHEFVHLRSKSIDAFINKEGQAVGDHHFDYILAVCSAAGAVLQNRSQLPFPLLDWPIANPYEEGDFAGALSAKFDQIYALLSARLDALAALNLEQMSEDEQAKFISRIGQQFRLPA